MNCRMTMQINRRISFHQKPRFARIPGLPPNRLSENPNSLREPQKTIYNKTAACISQCNGTLCAEQIVPHNYTTAFLG
jgi:hypothetical protein